MTNSEQSNTRLFVGSLPYSLTEGQLLSYSAPYGRIVAIGITRAPWGKNRGFGYVEFDSAESATTAKNALHNSGIEGRSIIVDFAKPDPYKTIEGQERHYDAVRRHPRKFEKRTPSPDSQNRPRRPFRHFESSGNSTDSPKPFQKRRFGGKKPFSHSRQSVFDSRTHHAGVGAKFARRRSR